jgi:hypothetical protein
MANEFKVLVKVIFIDNESALALAIAQVFPKARQFFYIFYINQAILAKIWKEYQEKDEEYHESFLSDWQAVVKAKTEQVFKEKWNGLMKNSSWKRLKKYFEKTWLLLKEQFYYAWTDNCMYFNQRATSRVESSYNALKRALKISIGDLKHVVDIMELLVMKQVDEYKYQLNASQIRLVQAHQIPLFD